MVKPSFPVPSEARTRASLEAEFTRAVTTPGLSPLVGREWEALFPRFARHYQQLTRLPRRALQRQWKQSLAALALLLALGQAPALAATIPVTTNIPDIVAGSGCSLIEAIENANNDFQTHADCRAGSGADTLRLKKSSVHTLTGVNNMALFGATGLPVVSSKITIRGRGSTIRRDPADTDLFRIFAVDGLSGGNLTLKETTVSGGTAALGGGIFNYSGTVTLTKSTVSGNSAASRGGGLYNYSGTVTLTNSTVSGNSAARGGGIHTYYDTVTLTNSTVSGNSAASGGGIYTYYGTVTLNRTLVSGNTAPVSAEIHNDGVTTADNFNLFGHSGLSNAQAFVAFTPGTFDINATSDGTNTPLANILNSTLANNGGPTKTHALVVGSPAIDAVTDGSCPPPSTDQRGRTGPQGIACDIGAFEADDD